MATPLSADKMLAALKKEGVKVSERSGWRTHNRAGHGAWGPVHGIIIHHTAGADSSAGLNLVYNGRSDLPGPLAHAYLSKSGTVTLTGNGRANHAGLGDDDVLKAVIAETTLPKPNENNTDGNARFYGIEIANLGNGKDPYPAAQYNAAVKWAAAICRAHGWSEKSVIGHKEWTNQKIDPRGPVEGRGDWSMTTFRADIKKQLAGTYNKTTTPPAKESTSVSVIPGGPYMLDLSYSGTATLTGSAWADVTWLTENDDSASMHVSGSSKFGLPGWFTGAAYITFSGLSEGQAAQARIAEVDASGATVRYWPIVEGVGTGGSTFFAVPLVGKVSTAGHLLKIQVCQYDGVDDTATVTSARVILNWTVA